MPKVSKMLIVRSLYRTRSVPNENKKKGMSSISECGLCRVEFTDLCNRAACHVLGMACLVKASLNANIVPTSMRTHEKSSWTAVWPSRHGPLVAKVAPLRS